MKCSELARHVQSLACFAGEAGGHSGDAHILRELLNVAPDRTVAQFIKARAWEANSASAAPIADFVRVLDRQLSDVLKPAILKDLKAIATAIVSPGGTELAEVVVQKYCRSLEVALGDDAGFREVIAALKNDPQVRVVELVEIAKRFAFASAKTRPAALKKIEARHQALMTSRAKAVATAGRIAG